MTMTLIYLSSVSSSSSSSSIFVASDNQLSSRRRCPHVTSSASWSRVRCRGGSSSSSSSSIASHLKFSLHDALDSSGIQTELAREARGGFLSQVKKLSGIERETSICINNCVDLGRAALCIAAEDDSLVSHSSVPLPIDAFIDRLNDLSMGFCTHRSSELRSSPESFLESIQSYLYGHKGFRRSNAKHHLEPRALYLHSVLTHRSGSVVMLSLIYSEILKMLRLWSLLDFDAEIFVPHDSHSLPIGYDKRKSKESDQPHIMTSQHLLVEMLSDLKEAFWPFQRDSIGSLFLRAAHAANCVDRPRTIEESASQLGSSKAAQHRLEHGVWTRVQFGDMRRALAASERLILLQTDEKELRDYAVLLYHCGLYEQSLQYLKLYQESQSSLRQKESRDSLSRLEEEAVEKLMVRLNLISMEEGWTNPSFARNFHGNKSEPW